MRIHNTRQEFAWCQELMFITACLTMATVSSLFFIFFHELISYHSFTVPIATLLGCGLLGTVVSFIVHYQRFFKQEQSRCCLIMVGCVFICCGIGSIVYMSIFTQRGNHLGNLAGYRTEKMHKRMIDKTQILFKCCGDVSYKDWFKVDWQGMDSVKWGQSFPMDVISRTAVPFSCCSPKARPPCVHNYLQMDKDAKLYRGGCKESLVFFGSIFLFITATALVVTGVLMLQWGYCCQDELDEPKYSVVAYEKASSSGSCSTGSSVVCTDAENADCMVRRVNSDETVPQTEPTVTSSTVNTSPDAQTVSPFATNLRSPTSESSLASKDLTDKEPDKTDLDTGMETETGAGDTVVTSPLVPADVTLTEGDTDEVPDFLTDMTTDEETGNDTEADTENAFTDDDANGVETDPAEVTDTSLVETSRDEDTDLGGDTDASEARGGESTGPESETGTNDVSRGPDDEERENTTGFENNDEKRSNDSASESSPNAPDKTDTSQNSDVTVVTVQYSDSSSQKSNPLSIAAGRSPSQTSFGSSRRANTAPNPTTVDPLSNEATLGSNTDITANLDSMSDEEIRDPSDFNSPPRRVSLEPEPEQETQVKNTKHKTAGKSLKWNPATPNTM